MLFAFFCKSSIGIPIEFAILLQIRARTELDREFATLYSVPRREIWLQPCQRCHLPMAIGRSTDEAGDLPMDFQNLPINEIFETSKTSFLSRIIQKSGWFCQNIVR
jgi:hypothetical protein